MLCQLQRQCKKRIAIYHDKIIDTLNLGCTLPHVANICLHKPTDAKCYPFTEGDINLSENFENLSLVVHLSFLHAKQLLMKLLSESLQTFANLLLGLMPTNYTPTRCVNQCPLVFKRVGTSIQKPVDSHLDKTTTAALKIRSCFIFNVQDLFVKLRASTLQADRRKLTASVLMSLVLIAILCLKQWVAFTTFVPVKSSAHLSLKMISNRGKRNREPDELRRGYIQEKSFTVLEKWECEWWRLYYLGTFPILIHCQYIPYLNTLNRTKPYLNTLNQTIPFLNTLPNHTLS